MPSRRVWAALFTVMVVGLAGCGNDATSVAEPETTTTTETPTTTATTATTTTTETTSAGKKMAEPDEPVEPGEQAQSDEYCVLALQTQRVVDRGYVGSQEHVAEFDALLAVAPDDIQLARDHFANSVDPSNPPSQDFENFPADVQDAARRIQAHITASC